MQFLDGFGRDAVLCQLCVDIVETDFVEFVDSHRDVNDFIRLTDDFCYAGKNLAVVDFDAYTDAETGEYGIDNLHKLHFVNQG